MSIACEELFLLRTFEARREAPTRGPPNRYSLPFKGGRGEDGVSHRSPLTPFVEGEAIFGLPSLVEISKNRGGDGVHDIRTTTYEPLNGYSLPFKGRVGAGMGSTTYEPRTSHDTFSYAHGIALSLANATALWYADIPNS